MLGEFRKDITYSLRLFGKQPAITAIVVFTLALGIGANSAIFSVGRAFLVKPVSFPELDRLVMLLEWAPQHSDYWNSVAPANFLDWKKESQTADGLAAFAWQDINITGSGQPERVQGFRVTSNFFNTLEVGPERGRTFLPSEEETGHDQVVILSQRLWERRFGRVANIVGTEIHLNGKSFTVIGVMGKEFNFPLTAELWTPLAMDPTERNNRTTHSLVAFGRIKPGVSLLQVRAEMNRITELLGETYPSTNKGWGARVMPIREFINGSLTRQFTLLLMGAVSFVLLIVCVNVANLQLVRSTARRREIAVRVCLGASKWRLARQLLTESTLLALAGAALSLLFAEAAIQLLVSHANSDMVSYLAGWEHIRLDGATFSFTLVLAVLAGILSGLAPAVQAWRLDLNTPLKENARSSGGRARRRLRNVFVISQVALSLILLAGAGLIVKGFWVLSNLHRSLDPQNLLTMRINLDTAKYRDLKQRSLFYDRALESLATLPGVRMAAVTNIMPFGNRQNSNFFRVEGQPVEDGQQPVALIHAVSPGYFHTMQVAIISGREFRIADNSDSHPVTIISRNVARHFWQQEDPVGKRIKLGRVNAEDPWRTVVGVVEDVQYDWTDPAPEFSIYLPYRQFAFASSFITLRTEENPAGLSNAVRSRMAEVDTEEPVFQLKTLSQVISDAVTGVGYVAVFLGILGVIALILAALGVYGILAQAVSERMLEISVRMALGAQPRNVLALVLVHGILLTGIGLAIGLGVSLALARFLSNILTGLTPNEAGTLSSISLLLTVVSFGACYFPARRASQVDPTALLREQ